MTEAEWLACDDLRVMEEQSRWPGGRKSMLFRLACCTRVTHLISDSKLHDMVAFVTQSPFVDQSENGHRETLNRATELLGEYERPPSGIGVEEIHAEWIRTPHNDELSARYMTTNVFLSVLNKAAYAWQCADGVCGALALEHLAIRSPGWRLEHPSGDQWQALYKPAMASLCEVYREVVGNPFREVLVDVEQLNWKNNTVPCLAHSIYTDRSWDAMPILADALEEAGCTDAAILQHCREKRDHVRGCWVLDLLLGKS